MVYSAGQVVYTTHTGAATGSVAGGVQQPFEISVVTEIGGATGISMQCTVFPNPTAESVLLTIENINADNLSYKLYDFNGKPDIPLVPYRYTSKYQ